MTTYTLDPLRDARHREARAARECADWLAALEIQGKAPRTRQHYAYTVWDLLEANMEKAVSEMGIGDIEQLLVRYPQAGLHTRIAHLNSFFRYLRRRRLIEENPMEFLEPRRRRRPRLPDTFTDAEIALMYGVDAPDGPLLTLMVELGLRKTECINLQLKQVVLSRAECSVLDTKGGKDRIVPATPTALAAVVDIATLEGMNPDSYFWYSKPGGGKMRDRSRPISSTTFARWFRDALEQAGVRYRKPHMSRHTRATRMRRLGYDLDEIQLFLGHDSIQTTKDLYVHTDIYDVAARMAELEGAESSR